MTAYTKFINEGGEGYGSAEMATNAWEAKCQAFVDQKNAEFAKKWTKEYTAEMRAEWNKVTKETGKYAGKVKGAKCYGISDGELRRAVEMHNLAGT